MKQTKVKDLMTRPLILISPEASLIEAAAKMYEADCGILPVGKNARLEELKGMITDRDIVIRAVAKGKDLGKEKVKDYMTNRVFACREDELLEDAIEKMRTNRVSRLIVKDNTNRAIGLLSFGDILRKDENLSELAFTLKSVSHWAA